MVNEWFDFFGLLNSLNSKKISLEVELASLNNELLTTNKYSFINTRTKKNNTEDMLISIMNKKNFLLKNINQIRNYQSILTDIFLKIFHRNLKYQIFFTKYIKLLEFDEIKKIEKLRISKKYFNITKKYITKKFNEEIYKNELYIVMIQKIENYIE